MKRDVVLQTDFGADSISVAAMKGVCRTVDSGLQLFDATHSVIPFDVLNAGDMLVYNIPYWPAGTVFVSVVDPGVGTARRSCVAQLANGSYLVTPDNGTLTYVKEQIGIAAVREIDESVNRLPSSGNIHIFHGRDVYAYCAARLAAGIIDFEGVGPAYSVDDIVMADYLRPEKTAGAVSGMISEASAHFGHIGSNIPFGWLQELGAVYGDRVRLTVEHAGKLFYTAVLPLEKSFGYVPVGHDLVFSSETGTVMAATNRGNFALTHGFGSGPDWKLTLEKA